MNMFFGVLPFLVSILVVFTKRKIVNSQSGKKYEYREMILDVVRPQWCQAPLNFYYCMKLLEYEMDEETQDMIYKYMAERYHDISSAQGMIQEEYTENAQKKYEELLKSRDAG